jgi:uncharacterized protein (DUF1697 family)
MQMLTFIAFLRGINMAGHNTVKMNDLLLLFKGLGFNDSETYIQSGNVIFSSTDDQSTPEIISKIETAIAKKFSYQVPVMLRTVAEMNKLMSLNPFMNEPGFDPSKMAVILLYETASEAQIHKIRDVNYPPDKFQVIGKEIFFYCPNGFGRTKLYTNFFEKKMGVTGTARNWKTMTSILTLASNK